MRPINQIPPEGASGMGATGFLYVVIAWRGGPAMTKV
jgi:hypothetical protein